MSAPGGEPQPDGNQTQGQPVSSIQEISGGHHEQTYMGGQFGQYIQTQVNKTYNPVGEYGKPLKEGEFQVGCIITVHENCPISLSSRIFNATLHSDVTGDKAAAVKITAAEKRNYREANVHFSVPHHKNIVERIATNTFNFRGQPSIFIAMERCDCNLHDHVKKEKKEKLPFDEQKYIWIAYQILVGLDFLHSHNVIHSDFKPANVLLILNGNIVKLSDFGLSKPITAGKESTYATSPQAGTIGWQAPEVLKEARKITLATDIFPGGLVLYFVWSYGKHPYGDKLYSLQHNIAEGINQDLSQLLISNSDDAKPLLEWMLESDPTKRPTAKQVLDHEIFASLGSKPPKVTESKLYEIVNNAVEGIKNQDAATCKNESSTDQQKIIPLAVTVDQLSGAMKYVFETKKIDIFVGASGTAVEPGTFEIQSRIKVHELNPISASSRVYYADLRSGVTGTMPIVVKLAPFGPRFVREAKIHFSVPHHKNIVERIATDTFNYRGVETIFMAMERCDCNLYNRVKSEVRDRVEFDVEKYTWIAYQMLVGLDFLHSHNVVHGDVKPANVLLILNGNIVKLSDFSLSRAITHGNASTQLTSPQGGTTGWLAPEILEGTTRISTATDIFPCGLTLHFIWSHGKHAYGDRNVSLNHYIVEGINLDLSRMLVPFEADAKILLEKTFQRNPVDRPKTGELIQSPIFRRFGCSQHSSVE